MGSDNPHRTPTRRRRYSCRSGLPYPARFHAGPSTPSGRQYPPSRTLYPPPRTRRSPSDPNCYQPSPTASHTPSARLPVSHALHRFWGCYPASVRWLRASSSGSSPHGLRCRQQSSARPAPRASSTSGGSSPSAERGSGSNKVSGRTSGSRLACPSRSDLP